ncbi:hypothetical protein ACFL1N_09505 [Thermodesulfobacteriota bacterium]
MEKEKSIRGFNWFDKDWISKKFPKMMDHTIRFGMFPEDGEGTYGEMCMAWVDIDKEKLVPRLQVFSDAWNMLYTFHDLLKELAKVDNEDISQKQFIEILQKCGFKDLTSYESPYENEKEEDFKNV